MGHAPSFNLIWFKGHNLRLLERFRAKCLLAFLEHMWRIGETVFQDTQFGEIPYSNLGEESCLK